MKKICLAIYLSVVICFSLSLSILIISIQNYEEIKAIRNINFVIWIDNCTLPNNYSKNIGQLDYNISSMNTTTKNENITEVFKRSNIQEHHIYPRKGSTSSGSSKSSSSGSSSGVKSSSVGVKSSSIGGGGIIGNRLTIINTLLLSMYYRNKQNTNTNSSDTFMYNYLDFTKGILKLDENANLDFGKNIIILSITSMIILSFIFVGLLNCYYRKLNKK